MVRGRLEFCSSWNFTTLVLSVKAFFAFWWQQVIWQLSKACCGQSMLAAQFEYKRFGCKGDRERVIRKGLGHLCYVILLWRKKTYFVTLTRSLTDFAHIYTVCAKMSSMTEDLKLYVLSDVTLFPIPLHIDIIFDKCQNQQICVIFLFFNQLDWWFSSWRAALLKVQRHHQILRWT